MRTAAAAMDVVSRKIAKEIGEGAFERIGAGAFRGAAASTPVSWHALLTAHILYKRD